MLGTTLQDTELENSTVTNDCLCPAVILQCIIICILMFLHTPSGQESYYLNYLYRHVILQCFIKHNSEKQPHTIYTNSLSSSL